MSACSTDIVDHTPSEMEEEINNPLLNQHVIELVFSYCKLQTLLNCRLVCQIWNDEALRTLENKDTIAYIKGQNSIQRFLKCMDTSEDHPFTSFSIELPSSDESSSQEQILELLNILKSRLKQVKFEYEPPQIYEPRESEDSVSSISSDSEYEEMIIKLESDNSSSSSSSASQISFPILECLHIFSTNIFPPKSINRLPSIFNLLATPCLTNLSVQHLYDTDCAETVIKLINSSENAISSLKFPCNEFPKIIGRVNLRNLKELDICDLFHGSFATNNTIQCIIDSCPDLEKLSIEFGCRVSFDYIFKLCQTLSNSVKYLKLIIQDKNLLSRTIQRVNFYFPHMPKLKSLFLRYTNPGLVYFVDEIPELTSLELETPWTRKVRGSIFPGIEDRIYYRLKTLNLSEKITAEDVLKIHTLFPNLKVLCASFVNDDSLYEVYKYLENLEILVIDRNSCITDSGLCGIYKNEELKNLYKPQINLEEQLSEFYIKAENLSKLGNSIGSLKKLKTLKLVQAGLSWKSLVFGVSILTDLRVLAVQATVLKISNTTDLKVDNCVLQIISQQIPTLQNLAIWTRRNSERLTQSELQFLNSSFPQWEINVTIQTICSTT